MAKTTDIAFFVFDRSQRGTRARRRRAFSRSRADALDSARSRAAAITSSPREVGYPLVHPDSAASSAGSPSLQGVTNVNHPHSEVANAMPP